MQSTLDTVAPDVLRLRAGNPSPMTGSGTNTYLLQGDSACVVIDPGPALPAHLDAILAALGGRRLAAVLVTHAHLDHSALAPALAQATGAPVCAFGDARSGRSAVMQALCTQGLTGGGEGVDAAFRPDILLTDGQNLTFASLPITALHTPGHMGGHLCFALGPVLFSGDHVMGWSTSLISPPDGDMTAYMAQLGRLALGDWSLMLPGHGAPVTTPAGRLAELISHRQAREAQILQALHAGPATPSSLAAQIYTDIAPSLLPAAARNILAHLVDLHARNRVTTPDVITLEARFHTI